MNGVNGVVAAVSNQVQDHEANGNGAVMRMGANGNYII